MGTEGIWIPLVMSAIATGATVYNTRKTAKKQDNALAQTINNQGKKAKEADTQTRAILQSAAGSSPEAARAQALSQYTQALRSSDGVATSGLQQQGGASSRFNSEVADAALGVSKYGQDRAGVQATIDAPRRQREEEGFARARASTNLGLVERNAARQAFIDNLRLGGIQRNPFIDAGAGMLQGYAGNMSTGGGGGGAGAFTPDASAFGAGGNSTLYQGQSAFGAWGNGWAR